MLHRHRGGTVKTWKCTTCGATCKVDMLLGSPVLHKVPGGRMICRRSGERIFQPGVLDADGNLILRGISENNRSRMREPLPTPTWFPTWDGRTMPTLALPAKRPLGIWIPDKAFSQQKSMVEIYARSTGYIEWDPTEGYFSVSSRSLIRLTEQLLGRFPFVAVGREYNNDERCTASCRDAKGHLCTCSCQALHHGNGKWMSGWQIAARQTSMVAGKNWSWLLVRQG